MRKKMNSLNLNKNNFIFLFFIIAIIIFLLENPFGKQIRGNWFLVIIYLLTLVEGSIALVAASDLANSKWIHLIKDKLLTPYPMILYIAILFGAFAWRLESHPAIKNKNFWLSKDFFVIRNFVILLLSYLLAKRYYLENLKESNKKKLYAVLYLLSFVLSQSFVAFDWIMPLEYPWYSTLFGGYSFIESLYSGIAIGGIFYFLMKNSPAGKKNFIFGIRSLATLMFGFSLLWVGLFYAQFLVIWYGNIPEESSFLLKRITSFPGNSLGILVLICLFFVPFLTLLLHKFKENRFIVLIISILILFGIFIERLLYVFPVIKLSPVLFTIEFLLMSGFCLLFYYEFASLRV